MPGVSNTAVYELWRHLPQLEEKHVLYLVMLQAAGVDRFI